MIDYVPAVELAYQGRWAGTKDGDRSRSRALYVNTLLDSDPPFTPAQAFQVRDRLASEGKSPATTNRHLAAYCGVWRTLVQRGLLQQGPPSGLLLREPRGRTRVVTPDEFEKLLRLLPAVHACLVGFLYHTGCRVSEALKLDRSTLDMEKMGAGFVDTKNGGSRSVPLHPGALPWVYRVVYGGSRPTQNEFNREWASARKRMGLLMDEGFVPHALRHTAVTRWVAAGVPLPIVAKLAGHRSLKTTLRYSHTNFQDSLDSLKRAGIM